MNLNPWFTIGIVSTGVAGLEFALLAVVGVLALVLVFRLARRNRPKVPKATAGRAAAVVPAPSGPKPRHCPQCGAVLPQGVLDGLCPACLLLQGASPDSGRQAKTAPFVPPAEVEIARLFPQFEILEFIGKGGMGAVYKARQPALDRLVALKVLPAQAAGGADFSERFNREARALAKLNHPNIVGVYEFGQVEALHYFIMEYVDGANLRQLERNGRLSPRQALQILPEICDALQYAHDEGVVHRDIKPENVLIDRKGRVKIADFGLAKIMGCDPQDLRLTGEGQVMGTPHYMAPEQIEHPLEVDHRADIYSLGVVFYEMLTGELPLGRFAPPSRKVRIDVRLDEVVLRALEKEPELRYQHAGEVGTAVDTIAHTLPQSSGQPEPQTDKAAPEQLFPQWLMWAPFQSTQVREICTHMTDAEKREAQKRGLLFGFWNAATFFVPFFVIMGVPAPMGWVLGAGVFLLGLSFYPLWRRMEREQLCGTAWARQQGLTPDQLKGPVGRSWPPPLVLVGRRGGKAVTHWVGVLFFFVVALALAEAGAILASSLLMGRLDIRAVALAAGFALVFMGILVRGSLTTPIEQLTDLDGPGRPAGRQAAIISAVAIIALVLIGAFVFFAVFAGRRVSATARPPDPPRSAEVQSPRRNAICAVRCEGTKATIEYEADDAHEIFLFVGNEALGWSSRYAGANPRRATVEASGQIRMEDGSLGRGFIFQTEAARHYVAVTPDGPVPFGDLVFRPDSEITQEAGTLTFADIHRADSTPVPISVRVRPVTRLPEAVPPPSPRAANQAPNAEGK